MVNEIFIDTSGFYSMMARDDDRHSAASRIFSTASKKKRRFVTTDYVLDETATLLKARGKTHLAELLFETIDNTDACRVEWTDSERFRETQTYFFKHSDQKWSFTDCLSFVVMSNCKLVEALTKDHHFEQAGFVSLLK